jgi:hypothetical protein
MNMVAAKRGEKAYDRYGGKVQTKNHRQEDSRQEDG